MNRGVEVRQLVIIIEGRVLIVGRSFTRHILFAWGCRRPFAGAVSAGDISLGLRWHEFSQRNVRMVHEDTSSEEVKRQQPSR